LEREIELDEERVDAGVLDGVAFAEGESEIEAVFEAVEEGQTRHGKTDGAIDAGGIDERGVLVGDSLGAPLAGALDLTKTTADGVPDLVTVGRG
jgi:hypothetical protein